MNKYEYIGYNIKSLRESHGFKQNELANLLDISAPYLNAVEKGNKKPSLNLILDIAEKFEIDPAIIITKDENIKKLKILFEKHNLADQLSKLNETIQILTKLSN